MLAGVAELERETIREQMAENKMARWKEKKIFNGKAPFGYKWDKKNAKFFVAKDEAKVYQRIVEMYLSGISMKDISMQLKEEGTRGKKAYFSSAVISYMLKNSAYYGRLVTNQHVYKQSNKSGRFNRTKELKPPNEWIVYDLPKLISKTRWDEIQKKTSFNKVKSMPLN